MHDTEPAADPTSDEALADAFWTVARHLRHGAGEALSPYDVSPGHFRALGTLLRHGDMRLGALSEHLRIAPRSTTEVVDALEERGLVERRADPGDRRATVVTVTEKGRDLAHAVRSTQRSRQATMFAALSARDRAALSRILHQLGG